MLVWVGLAAGAQLLTACTVLIDRYVLVSRFYAGRPIVYTFYVSILSGLVLVLLPFGVAVPSPRLLALSLLVAATFMCALYLFYTALKRGHASDAAPIVGATTALVTSIVGFFILSADLPLAFVPAFALFIVGTFLISRFRLSWRSISLILLAGFFFGTSSVLLKVVFQETTFIDGFFWTRMGNVVLALSLLLWPRSREAILHSVHKSRPSTKWIIVGNKMLSGVASVMMALAISLGSVAIVQAMTGMQFAFLFGLVYVASYFVPKVFGVEVHRHEFRRKLYGTLFIIAGLVALFSVQ